MTYGLSTTALLFPQLHGANSCSQLSSPCRRWGKGCAVHLSSQYRACPPSCPAHLSLQLSRGKDADRGRSASLRLLSGPLSLLLWRRRGEVIHRPVRQLGLAKCPVIRGDDIRHGPLQQPQSPYILLLPANRSFSTLPQR
jgi:hypothetical protein